jgi:hypothetical protein
MAREVVLARSLADCEAYWNAQGRLSAAQERWREHERQWRTNLGTWGLLPAERLVADIRSGEKERRDQQNMRNLQRSKARLAQWKREGYTFDEEHRLVAPALARIDGAEPREPETRPQERSRTASRLVTRRPRLRI